MVDTAEARGIEPIALGRPLREPGSADYSAEVRRVAGRLEVIRMSAQPERARASENQCWCCGADRPEPELIRLGQHPEVGICLRCVRSLQRRAVRRHDEQHPSPAARLRGGIHAVRAAVIRKGWHRRGVLGAVLRGIDRYLP